MEPALQRRVQRYGWDKAAHTYELSWQSQLKPAHDLLLEMAQLKTGEEVLDLASGTGLVSFRAKEMTGDNGFVLGTDISDNMVEIAAALTRKKNFRGIDFVRMDAEDLQIADNTFSVAICALGLMYMPEPVKALKEMYRVLKPGGRAIAAVWGRRERCGWADIFEIVDKRVASEVCPMFFHLGNPDRLPLSFTMAEFSRISSRTISTKLHYATAEQACMAAFAGGPVALAYNKFSDDVKHEVHAEYLDSIDQYKSGNAYDVPGEFVVTIGYKD